MLYENESIFVGKPVRDFDPKKGIEDATGTVYRLRLDWDESEEGVSLVDRLAAFVDHPTAGQVPALIIGMWEGQFESSGDSSPIVAALAAARDKLPSLKALFIGDIQQEECEISWIMQSNMLPLFDAFPNLEVFGVRGGAGLSMGPVRHERLRELVIESGGLSGIVVRQVAANELPQLEHLELWLGTDEYGGDATLDDLAPILSGKQFPNLNYLGLRDCEMADELAEAVASADVLDQITVLDLSLGALTDRGARALLDSPRIGNLKFLDIHHHFVSDDMVAKLKGLGISINADDRQQEEEYDGEVYRYIAVSE